MSVLQLAAAMFGPSQSIGSDAAFGFLTRGGKTVSGVSVNELLALNLPVVYSCVSIISDSIAMLPISVQEYDSTSFTNISDHPIEEIIGDRPNMAMNPFTYRQTAQAHACLWGNHYSQIVLDGSGKPVAVVPLDPSSTGPKVKDGKLHYSGSYAGTQFDFSADEVLHLKSLGTDGFLGLSPITQARQAVGLGLAMETFGSKLFANDLRSGGFISHPSQLSPVAQANIKESMQAQAGLENAWQVKILEEGMTYTNAQIPPEDAQFLGSREFQIAEIARIFRVPLVLLQSKEGGTTWGTGIEQLMIAFARWTLQPWVVQWQQELTNKMLGEEKTRSGKKLRVFIDINGLSRGDMQSRSAYFKNMTEIGAMDANEVRVAEGLNPK